MKKQQNGFTMIELIVVLVVLGILAVYSIPRIQRDARTDAINHILTMIRYTQNLALHDNKQLSNNPKWQMRFWRFEINKCANGSGLYYRIGSDEDMSEKLSKTESAIDPSNNKYTYWNTSACPTSAIPSDISPNIFITQKYGINEVNFKSCTIMQDGISKSSSAQHIGFDSFGRYYKSYTASTIPNYNGVGVGDCKIEFKFEDSTIKPFTIVVSKETGYAYLEENPNL
jgi:prepilin-type N-terminal cleavage/methylation domain-containing protein